MANVRFAPIAVVGGPGDAGVAKTIEAREKSQPPTPERAAPMGKSSRRYVLSNAART